MLFMDKYPIFFFISGLFQAVWLLYSFTPIPARTKHRRSKLTSGRDQKWLWCRTKSLGNYEYPKVIPCSTVCLKTFQIFLASWHIRCLKFDRFLFTVFGNRLWNSIKRQCFDKRKVWAIRIVVIKKHAKQKNLNPPSSFWGVGTLPVTLPDRFVQITLQNWQTDWLASCTSPEPTIWTVLDEIRNNFFVALPD